jgi:hypothetical protein
LVTLVIVDVAFGVIVVLLVIEIVSVVIVVGGVNGIFDGIGAPTPHEHPPGEAECEAPRG